MELQHGALYRAPDGRVFEAQVEYPHYTSGPVWTFAPPTLQANDEWRTSLETLLFYENKKIGYFDFTFGNLPRFVDTGWDIESFVMVASD